MLLISLKNYDRNYMFKWLDFTTTFTIRRASDYRASNRKLLAIFEPQIGYLLKSLLVSITYYPKMDQIKQP